MKKHAVLRRKALSLLIAGCFSSGYVLANPQGAQVVNGQVSIASQGNVLTVTNSPGAIINWQSFSIGAGELTQFIQQGASSTVLNRIIGQDPSQILGALQSNGRVFLINPNGILFGQGAQVNVGGLVASTLNMSNEDFLAGRMKFQAGASAANLQNQGSITSAQGGQIYLIAPNVENTGVVTSPNGEVVLAAGHSVHLVDSTNPDLHVVVSAPDNQSINLGQVVAAGGNVGIYGALINQRGLVSADSAVVGENGKIVFKASKDVLLEAGSKTTATGAGVGGTVHVLGDRVGLTGDAKIDVTGQAGGGTVLVGGDFQGNNAAIKNAKQTVFGRDAKIKADAALEGNGGKVIVWADQQTRAYGDISAKGGLQAGDGGFVEVSGKEYLHFDARVNVLAPQGKAGSILLDPRDIIIQAGSGLPDDSMASDGFVDGADANALTDVTISNYALESLSGNITLQASQDVRFETGLNLYNLTSGNTFSVSAGRDIISTSGSDISAGGGAIDFTANNTIDLLANLNSGGGNINLTGTTGRVAVGGDLDAGSGAMNLSSGLDISLGGYVSAGGVARLNSGSTISIMNGISAPSLKMQAVGGINNGSTGPVMTSVGSLNIRNIGTGDVGISNSTPLTIEDIDSVGYGIKLDNGNIAIGTSGSNLNVNASVSTDSGTLSLSNEGQVNINHILSASGDIDVETQSGNLVNGLNGNITSAFGDVHLMSAGSIDNLGSITATNNSMHLQSSTGITHTGSATSGNYVLMTTSSAGALISTSATSQISVSPNGYVQLNADKMDLNGAINASGRYVTLLSTSSIPIDVGAAGFNNTQGTLELTNAALNRITTDNLIIGDQSASGPITIKSSLFSGSGNALEHIASLLTLRSLGAITQDANALIGAPALEAIGGAVTLMNANPTGVISGQAMSGDFQYHTSNLLTVSSGTSSSGISAASTYAVRLESDSVLGINQSNTSPIVAGQLIMITPGPVYLDNPSNAVDRVAADLYFGGTGTGSFALLNSKDISVDGGSSGITGITTNNQNVEISVPSLSFTIAKTQPISMGSGAENLRYDGLLNIPIIPAQSVGTESVAQDPVLNNAITTNLTDVIVGSLDDSSEAVGSMPDSEENDEQESSSSNGVINGANQSGVSTNAAAPKLYCN